MSGKSIDLEFDRQSRKLFRPPTSREDKKMFKVTGKIFLMAFLLAATTSTACNTTFLQGDFRTVRGSGKLVEEIRDLNGISGVSLATSGDLSIEVGNTESLRITADDNLIEFIKTEEKNGELSIHTTNDVHLEPTNPIHYHLTVKDLKKIAIYSSGDIQAPELKAEDFSVTVASSGDLSIDGLEAGTLHVEIMSSGDVNLGNLTAERLDVDINSSGDLEIAGGEVATQEIAINSSGDYIAPNLASREATANLNSSGSATIRVSGNLAANLNSSGDLRYHGNPSVNINRNSSGDVSKID
jgi:uncharacterized Zn-binding protein involved in type VI secretion